MSRRRRPEKREILPDPKFGDEVLSKFMNNLMLRREEVGHRRTYRLWRAGNGGNPRQDRSDPDVPRSAEQHQAFNVEVRSRRVGWRHLSGAGGGSPRTFAQALAIRWLITAARGRAETTMAARLFG